jgi:hypothetical protein
MKDGEVVRMTERKEGELCLPALSKLEFFSLALRKIALSLKSVFPILSSYFLIRSHSMFMLALVITIIIVDTHS